jgi:hypothetical protein
MRRKCVRSLYVSFLSLQLRESLTFLFRITQVSSAVNRARRPAAPRYFVISTAPVSHLNAYILQGNVRREFHRFRFPG